MTYEILDMRKSIFQDAVIVESKSPIMAAENHTGKKMCRHKNGWLLVASKSWPRRIYLYAEKKG